MAYYTTRTFLDIVNRLSPSVPGCPTPVIEQYVTKGSNVFVEGKLQTRKYEDKDGVEKYTTEVVLQGFNSTFTMLDSKSSESGAKPTTGAAIDDDDGIPF